MQSPSHRHPVRLRETHLDRCAPDVGDDTRQGALRFRIPGSDDFLREPHAFRPRAGDTLMAESVEPHLEPFARTARNAV